MNHFHKIIITIFLFYPVFLAAQENRGKKDSIRTAAALKTGNSQDVLISFFQLALNDITSEKKSFKFQSSLFAIKAKTDESLWIDTNYLKQKFYRNFVFSIAPAFDTSYKFQSNTIGFKYAIINKRDKTVFDFSRDADWAYAAIQRQALEEYAKRFADGTRNSNYQLALNFFLDADENPTSIENLPEDFKELLLSKMKNSIFRNKTIKEFRDTIPNQYNRLSKYVENRSLLTAEAAFSSYKNGRLFSGINITTEYLKGLMPEERKMNIEINLKASLSFGDDSLAAKPGNLNRQVFQFNGGFNWIILRNSKNKSLLELKTAVAYNQIFSGIHPGEEQQQFTGEGTLRLRVTNDIWIPVQINYDPANGNLFGFLSVRSNFDWLK